MQNCLIEISLRWVGHLLLEITLLNTQTPSYTARIGPTEIQNEFHGSKILREDVHKEYVHSVAVNQKYLTRLGEMTIFEPLRENYHFSQPGWIFLI